MHKLNSKVALVTGGASGLGKAIALRLAFDGAQVVISDIKAGLGGTVSAKEGLFFLQQDVCDELRWRDVLEEIERRFGGLNILVNNAGILGPAYGVDPENTSLESWRQIFAVNVESVFLGCRAAIPMLHKAGGGSIINLSSIGGVLATPQATAYGASKAAVRQLTKSVAQHCAARKLNIRCNSLHPGMILTPLWEQHARETARMRNVSVDAIMQEARAVIPLGDFTRAEDVAGAASFLASEDARHITGMEMFVDGGMVNCDTYLMNA